LDGVSYIDNSLVAAPDLLTRWATAMKVLGMYFQLLIFPHPMVCDRSYNQIPNVKFSDIWSILSVVVYMAMFIYAILRFKKKDILSFSILFYLVTIALFSNIFMLIGSIMADRFLYFASFGFCLAVATLLARLFKTTANIQLPVGLKPFLLSNAKLLAVTGLIIMLYSFKTINRNTDWKNNLTLYSHDVNVSSRSTRMHYYLGRELVKETAPNEKDEQKKKEYFLQGIAELQKAIAITPSYSDAYSQMGLGYSRMGNKEKAIECYLGALKYTPNDPIAMNNLGSEYFMQGKYAECIDIYKKILTISPRYVDAMVNLGSCYGTVRNYDDAIFWFKRSIEINPNNPQACMFLSMTYKLKGDAANADLYYKRAIELDPSMRQK
jgi:tetratricopeptide (TPR) repeat protein